MILTALSKFLSLLLGKFWNWRRAPREKPALSLSLSLASMVRFQKDEIGLSSSFETELTQVKFYEGPSLEPRFHD